MTRFFDIVLSSIAVIVLFPFMLPVMLVLKLTGEHYIFYGQTRLGRGGRPFKLLKFATMLKDSPNMTGGDVTVRNDPRVLPFGKFLRKTKINELPQLLNILKGDMSIVGPRPQTPRNFELFYGNLGEDTQQAILSMRPGLSGIASIMFRDEETLLEKSGMGVEQCQRELFGPYKAKLELWYKAHQGLLVYFQVIFVTAAVVLCPRSTFYTGLWKNLQPVPGALPGSLRLI